MNITPLNHQENEGDTTSEEASAGQKSTSLELTQIRLPFNIQQNGGITASSFGSTGQESNGIEKLSLSAPNVHPWRMHWRQDGDVVDSEQESNVHSNSTPLHSELGRHGVHS